MKDFESFLRKRFIHYKEIAKYAISKGEYDNYYNKYKPMTDDERGDFSTFVKTINQDNFLDFKYEHVAHKREFDEYLTSIGEVFEGAPTHKPSFNESVDRFTQTELKFKEQLSLYIIDQRKKHLNFEDISLSPDYKPDRELSSAFYQSVDTFNNNLGEIDLYKLLRSQKEADNEFLAEIENFQEEESKNALPIKECFEGFLEIRSKNVQSSAIASFHGSFNFLYSVIGENFDLRKLDKKKAIEIQKAVINKPLGTKKGSGETLANKTVNRYISNYSSLLEYLITGGFIDKKNPFAKMKLDETKKNSKTRRRPYTNEEALKILSYEPQDSREAKSIRRSAYWFPKIAFYSGMRLSEITDLTVNDFKGQGGIHFIDLYDKILKNENSERRIPIHSKLIEYGLLDYIKDRKQAKSRYIFDDLRNRKLTATLKKDGWGITVSDWYNRNVFKNLSIVKLEENGDVLDFHGIRTTMLKNFKRNGLSGYLVKQLAGHLDKDDDVTFDEYGHGTNTKLTRLKEIIETINYDE